MASADTVAVLLSADETRALLQDVPKVYHTQINDVLLTALMQAFAWWTGAASLLITLESHGRDEIFEAIDLSRTIGWFTSIFPVQLRLKAGGSPEDALIEIKELLRRIPHHGICYGLLRYLSDDPEIVRQLRTLPKPDVRFNYLGQFDQVLSGASMFRRARESYGPARDPQSRRTHVLAIEGLVTEGQLRFEWIYSTNMHHRSRIEGIANHYLGALRALISRCLLPDAGGFTPSDFPLAHLDDQQFDRLARIIERLEDVSG
jgi:non-ribosomal peptide synthase protein (TIGR01720 family)